jgi:hypothetical protein
LLSGRCCASSSGIESKVAGNAEALVLGVSRLDVHWIPLHAAEGKLSYGTHQALLLRLLKLRIAMKHLSVFVPPSASPLIIVEVVIDGVRRFLCQGHPLEPIDQTFPDRLVTTAERASCNSLWQPE